MRLLVTGGSGFIGTNLVEDFAARSNELLNVDIHPPLDARHRAFWRPGDILNPPDLNAAFSEFAPTHVLHMAARTDCDENTTVEEGYSANTVGTRNVLAAVETAPSVERIIVVSTQYVCGPGRWPQHDEDFFPRTIYGHSKAITEQMTRNAALPCVWTIVRPTNIWGPWHFRYRREVWRVIRNGYYLHPGGGPVIRSYGYVGNVVWQLRQILHAPKGTVHGQVFYLGDTPIDIYEWVSAFSIALRGNAARKVPRVILRGIGAVGDVLAMVGRTFPLTSSRYTSMTQDYLAPMEKTFDTFGPPPSSLQDGVRKSLQWLAAYGRD